MKKFFLYLTPALAALSLTSCVPSWDDKSKPNVEYMPDMYRSVAYETYSANPLYADSMTSRQPVSGTIARGDKVYNDYDRLPVMDNYPSTPEGYEQAGLELKNPLEKSEANLAEGKRLYENYCLVCHGTSGQGDGPVPSNNGPKPPAYNSDLLKTLPEGKMFHSIHYGKNMMGSHASQLTQSQRWMIVQYVQTLQHYGEAAAAPKDSVQTTASATK